MTAQKVEDMHRQFEAAFNAADLAALVALYAPDAALVPSPGKLARGKSEIRAAFEYLLSSRPNMQLRTAAVFETSDGTALTHGEWKMSAIDLDGNPLEVAGKSAEVLRRQPDGRWLYMIDNPFAG